MPDDTLPTALAVRLAEVEALLERTSAIELPDELGDLSPGLELDQHDAALAASAIEAAVSAIED